MTAPALSDPKITLARLATATALVAMCLASAAESQVSPRTADTTTSMYDADGIKVIHRRATSDIVVANLYLLGGARQVTRTTAGIEPLLLAVSEKGTATYSKEKLQRTMAQLGTGIAVSINQDWTAVGIRATRGTFDSTWAIFASRVREPTIAADEVEVVKRQFLLAVAQRRDSPDALVEYLADSLAFAGHPYGVPAGGTEESIGSLSAADLKAYHEREFVKSRMLLVVVGNVSEERVRSLIGRTLARLPAGSYSWTVPDSVPRRPATVHAVSRSLPTNYMVGRYPGPRAGTKDYYALRIAAAVLAGQLFAEIRNRRNLTYAVDAPFIDRAISAGGLYVTTVSPKLTVDIMRQQLAAIRTSTVDEDALARLIRQFVTQFFMENETNTEQADFLAKSYLYEGDYRAVGRFEEQLRSISPEDIRRVAQRWIKDVQWAYVGDVSRVPKSSMENW